jgi:alkaline phosphatase D
VSRRRFLARSILAAGGALGGRGFGFPAIVGAESARPLATHGAAVGDVVPGRALVWSRADRPARMFVEWSMTEAFADARRVAGPAALEGKTLFSIELPAGSRRRA